MSYRKAKALDTLFNECNKLAPRRSRASDGWIGDAAHASRDSDHNPWTKDRRGVGVVRAADVTHDPANGLDGERLAKHLAAQLGKHPALGSGAYVIWRSRIISTDRLREGWRPYGGSNPHDKHVHLSLGYSGYDSTKALGIVKGFVDKALKKVTGKYPVYLHVVAQQAKAKKPGVRHSVRRVQKALNRELGTKLRADGVWGPATAKAYRQWQKANGFRTNRGIGVGSLRKLVKKNPHYIYLP